jgi:hypothetical protein
MKCVLKVSKCEIFYLSDCHDFYTIKFPRVGDFGVKIILKLFRGFILGCKIPYVYTKPNFKDTFF